MTYRLDTYEHGVPKRMGVDQAKDGRNSIENLGPINPSRQRAKVVIDRGIHVFACCFFNLSF